MTIASSESGSRDRGFLACRAFAIGFFLQADGLRFVTIVQGNNAVVGCCNRIAGDDNRYAKIVCQSISSNALIQ
ncbi:hypothetical protein C7B82_11410 [Stenomitos frigidus ULC18]|uniref:Uncharacterized protein n=1 Tax=Stenomitos frigidus ULC18 TaxID=2107698 RepID=A0A2T1E9P5_9CYAN|nr:hypothetical protein C7B82_11410 [Stenomitos frigidus ULC18]